MVGVSGKILTSNVVLSSPNFDYPIFVATYASNKVLGAELYQEYDNRIDPPVEVIERILNKIVKDEAEGSIITPNDSTQPWFTKLKSISIRNPIIVTNMDGTFNKIDQNISETKPDYDTIIVWTFKGNHRNKEDCEFINLSETAFENINLPSERKQGDLRSQIIDIVTDSNLKEVPENERENLLNEAHLQGNF
ncbi:hypothetical protein O9G_005572 [Rozella allomycis CSF55]|uniref:Uncharacterized protein n=1 Tax=Rozella allomycis (strain CSF55) TaxID=988480 RepID=A0A075AUT5_ROZAC|nr:hypothetical protein O9G_005572 [Rozella allomycis CSF55]|eukprot:EPZ32477.1 hypothetical protein O9G_005572 [Rozella allomycis CSF55]